MVFKDFSEHSATQVIPLRSAGEGFYAKFGKRAFDITVSLILLVPILLVLIPAAIAIKLTSKGPVFFKQTRHGLNKTTFKIMKLRSMSVMEDGAAFQQARKNDTRITPVGAFLRKTSLDELPQIFNVLMGDMSLIGPRPHAIKHDEEFVTRIPNYDLRFNAKPGITGLAQMRGHRGPTETDEPMRLRVQSDVEYMRSVTAWMDLRILVGTVFSVLGHKNAF